MTIAKQFFKMFLISLQFLALINTVVILKSPHLLYTQPAGATSYREVAVILGGGPANVEVYTGMTIETENIS
jgi:hypothetical protein